jgi:hypothetical protein
MAAATATRHDDEGKDRNTGKASQGQAGAESISAKPKAAQAANVRFYRLFIRFGPARRAPPHLQIERHNR